MNNFLSQWLSPGRSKWLFWIALIAISILAFMPGEDVSITTGWDKSNHALAFFTLAFFADYAWPRQDRLRLVLALVGYGIFIEVVQYFVGRDASALDVLGDSTGILIYGGFAWLMSRVSRAAI